MDKIIVKGARENNVVHLKNAKLVMDYFRKTKLQKENNGKYSYSNRDNFIKEVKKDLLRCGSLEMFVSWKNYYCGTEYGVVIAGKKGTNELANHGVSIIGWDDNFDSWNIELDVNKWQSSSGEPISYNEKQLGAIYDDYKSDLALFNNKGAFLCKNSNSYGNLNYGNFNLPNNSFSMNGKSGWICAHCKNFNYESNLYYFIIFYSENSM